MLRVFCAVADHGSLADAAEALGRTPSAVSMMLRRFEDHIGAPLFESARKSHLTPLGRLIRDEAARELEHFERTVARIEGLAQARQGRVRIAVTPSVAQVVMPPILRRFMADHPGVRIEMSDTDSATIERELEAGRADIGLATIGPMAGFERELLFSDPYGVVCPVDHRLARNWSRLTWADMADTTLIANGLCRQITDEGFRPILEGATLMVRNTASLLSLVRSGVGVTILPELAVLPEFLDLEFLPLVECSTRREVWMFTRPDIFMTPATRAFVATIRASNVSGRAELQDN
ncbi:LysR family transcriptional regulator [Roseovarius sp. SCSIO 43702]|uniref:LysR family transcriptional regulator n=1 Tax=Roseovarius sp. SCSIO 43702 TaxID=2823043 RepID=UPI002175BC22|nr:LysR family transcriptional regulator [Roseovarius sp. SCSIO 43702]